MVARRFLSLTFFLLFLLFCFSGVNPDQHVQDRLLDPSTEFMSLGPDAPLAQGDFVVRVGVADIISDLDGASRVVVTEDTKNVAPALFECLIARDVLDIPIDAFEGHFGARVLSVARQGKTLPRVIVDFLRRNDVVVLESSYAFLHHTHAAQFANVRRVEAIRAKKQSALLSRIHPWLVLVLLIAMVTLAALNLVSLFAASSAVLLLMLLFRVLSWNVALASMQPKTLLLISCSFALAEALDTTGAVIAIWEYLHSLLWIRSRQPTGHISIGPLQLGRRVHAGSGVVRAARSLL